MAVLSQTCVTRDTAFVSCRHLRGKAQQQGKGQTRDQYTGPQIYDAKQEKLPPNIYIAHVQCDRSHHMY